MMNNTWLAEDQSIKAYSASLNLNQLSAKNAFL